MSRVPPRFRAALVTVGAGLVAAPAAHADTSLVQRSLNALVGEDKVGLDTPVETYLPIGPPAVAR
ncbi:hypothetical protein [Paractinoplanes maris]|uniref:hypothetical protein n=1 Tax=Paractinoplanes maris TaxID=1734446 RepID=UPI0020217784|nr:hypothetical protein [Actinoplanes maris]